MDTTEALISALKDHNFFEPGVDCSDAKRFAETIAEHADSSLSNTDTVFNKMAYTIQFAAKRMIDTPEHQAVGTREALNLMFSRASAAGETMFGPETEKLVDLIDEIVIARLGEMPMPGEAAAVVKGLSDSIKSAGVALLKQNSYSR